MLPAHRHTDIRFNMAPMIDVVFLLIIFFILVSTFASAESVEMELPHPKESQAKHAKITDRVVINCRISSPVPTGTARVVYSVGPNQPESLATISRRIAAARAQNPKLKVIIRADKRLRYDQVRAAMEVVTENEIENMNLVALVGSLEE